jgi:dihydropyrimidinase
VLPGGVDPHVHLTPPRTGPGIHSWADDFEVGTRAALAGGVTTVGNMSFPRSGEQMMAGMERDLADAAAHAVADYFQHPVLLDPDDEGIDQIAELTAMGHPSVKIFLSFKRFDRQVDRFVLAMRRAAEVGSVVLVHCEDAAIMGCCGDMLREQGLDEHRHYPETRPVEAERVATERAIGYCETTGAATYVVHLSSQAALAACRRGRARGLPLYVETRPIYLHLERSRFDEPDGAKYAGAPPLRLDADREALWSGIADGTVSTVATDHAPWTLAQKLDPALGAAELRQKDVAGPLRGDDQFQPGQVVRHVSPEGLHRSRFRCRSRGLGPQRDPDHRRIGHALQGRLLTLRRLGGDGLARIHARSRRDRGRRRSGHGRTGPRGPGAPDAVPAALSGSTRRGSISRRR